MAQYSANPTNLLSAANSVLKPLHDLLAVIKTLGGRILVVEKPKKADVIVVLGGDAFVRIQLALRLFMEGWAPHVAITTDADWQIFARTETQLAEEFVRSLPPDFARATHVLPMTADSTLEEAAAIGQYMDVIGASSALLVTSDFHTRRALSIFSRALPEKQFGIRGAADTSKFGVCWWKKRVWAKRALGESTRLAWWFLVDRWRCHPVVTHATLSPIISAGPSRTNRKLNPWG